MSALLLLLLAAADGGLLAKPVKVSAEHLEVLNAEGRAVYTGHAHALRGTTVVDCDELVVFFGKDHQVQSIDAKGHVVAVDGDRHMWGEAAHFDNLTGVLEVTGQPKVQSGTKSVEGERVLFTEGSDRLEVFEPRTLAEQEKGEQAQIEAHHLLLLDQVETATWTGEVKAKKGTTRLYGPELTARYDEKGEVKHLSGRGGVHVVDKDREAWGQALEYDLDQGVVVVTGKPRARDGQKRITGSRVRFLTQEDRLEVEDAVSVFENEEKKGPKK